MMEIQDAGFDLLDNVSMTTDANIGFVGANIAILLGKKKQVIEVEINCKS